MVTSAKDIVNRFKGSTALPTEGDIPGSANDVFKRQFVVTALAFEADDNTQRQLLAENPFGFDLRLISAKFVPEAAVTADNTNYSTIDVYHTDDPAGSLTGPAASGTTEITGLDDFVANTPVVIPLSSTEANKILPAGEYAVLALDGTAGVGVDLPVGVWSLVYEVA